MILIDTHILLWLSSEPAKMKSSLLKIISQSQLTVSSISAWEISIKMKKNKLKVDGDFRIWWFKAINKHNIEVINPDFNVLVGSVNLDWTNPDPADRIIISIALENNLALMTLDQKIIQSNLIETISK